MEIGAVAVYKEAVELAFSRSFTYTQLHTKLRANTFSI